MINFMNNWVKNLSLALVFVSILEMILPNNKTKKPSHQTVKQSMPPNFLEYTRCDIYTPKRSLSLPLSPA